MARPKFNINDLVSKMGGGAGGAPPPPPPDLSGGPPPDLSGGTGGATPPLPGGGAMPIGGPAMGAPMGAGALPPEAGLPPIPSARPKKKGGKKK